MPREFQMYQGAVPTPPKRQQVAVPQIESVPMRGAQIDRAVDGAERVVLQMADLHDLGVQQREELALKDLDAERKSEFERRSALRWGDEESFFNEDGTRNQYAIDAFNVKYQERNDGIARHYWLGRNRVLGQYRHDEVQQRIQNGLEADIAALELQNIRSVWKDNYEAEVLRGNFGTARSMVGEAEQRGLLRPSQARCELARLSREELRAVSRSAGFGLPGSVSVGGREFSGLSAALAMEDAREAVAQGGAWDASVREEEEPSALMMMPQDGGDAFASQDVRGVVSTMPQAEFDGVADAFAFDSRVLTMPRGDGGVVVCAAPYAPECVQRVAAVGSARGGIDAQQARMMVARIALDAVAQNPEVSAANVVGMFDASGIYEAMGDGDAAVGEERCRAVVSECLARGGGDSRKLGMAAIEPMLKAHLASREFAEGREWGRVLALNPQLDKGKAWDKSGLDEVGRRRWFALYDVYRKYRSEYKPDAAGELDKDEFEQQAQAFYDWYVKEKLPGLRRADVEAAGDWYRLQIVSRLRERVYEDGGGTAYAGYSGYGADVQVARDVLRMSPPERLGADELMEVSRRMQAMDAARSKKFRQRAQDDYARLRELKRDEAASSEEAVRRREREQRAEERKAEREARDAERQAEKVAARRLFVARSAPREAEWVWDGQNAPDGAQPGCALPEAEYRRLYDELGYDGSQLVYVQVNGARVLVTGVSRSGRLELNAPAVAKVQKKPNRKNGERWRTSGRLGYSYYFHSAKAE